MIMMKNAAHAFTILLLVSSPFFAQSPPEPTAKVEQEQKEQLRKDGLSLLDEAATAAAALRLPENRAVVFANLGDSFWKHDEKRARELFADAVNALSAAAANGGKSPGRRSRRGDNGQWATFEIRRQVIGVMARRDAQTALDALRASRGSDGDARAMHGPGPEAMLEQQLAAQIAAQDPQKALALAEESLAKGVPHSLVNTIVRLHEKDPAAAGKLIDAFNAKLRDEETAGDVQAVIAVMNLLQMSAGGRSNNEVFIGNLSSGMFSEPEMVKKPKAFKLEEAALRQMAQSVVGAAAKLPAGSQIYQVIGSQLALFERYVPEQTQQLRAKLTESRQGLDPAQRAWAEHAATFESGTTEELLAAAAKAPPEVQSSLVNRAVWKLLEDNKGADADANAERARRLVNERLRSSAEREEMLSLIDQHEARRAIEKGDLEKTRQLLAGVEDDEVRAAALAQLALGVAKRGDKKTAVKLLDEAHQAVEGSPADEEQLQAQLQVAAGYAFCAPERSFGMIEALVDRANELTRAAAVLNGFGVNPNRLFKNGEMNIAAASSGGSFGATAFQHRQPLVALARADRKRLGSIAERFDRAEIQVIAKMLIARALLADEGAEAESPAQLVGN